VRLARRKGCVGTYCVVNAALSSGSYGIGGVWFEFGVIERGVIKLGVIERLVIDVLATCRWKPGIRRKSK